MTMALYQLPLTSLGSGETSLTPGGSIGEVTFPETAFEFSADFAPVTGDFLIPSILREGWSSASGGDAYLVPVFSGGEVTIGTAAIPEINTVLLADFAPLSGDFRLPLAVQDGWSSASGGDAYLVPVYSGDA